MEPALNFAEQGILLTIKNDRSQSWYFNCVPWSDFPYEDERLCIGGYTPLRIIGLCHVPSSTDFSIYITAMQMFYDCINGDCLTNGTKLISKYSKCGRKLVKKKLNLYNKQLPQYMVQLFDEMCNKKGYIVLDINRLNNNFLFSVDAVWDNKGGFGECYGFKKWKHIFIDDNNRIKFGDIHMLFPNSVAIFIQSVQPLPKQNNKYKYTPSILITSTILDELLDIILPSESKCKQIQIFEPKNTKKELEEMISKYCPNDQYSMSLIKRAAQLNKEPAPCFFICKI